MVCCLYSYIIRLYSHPQVLFWDLRSFGKSKTMKLSDIMLLRYMTHMRTATHAQNNYRLIGPLFFVGLNIHSAHTITRIW